LKEATESEITRLHALIAKNGKNIKDLTKEKLDFAEKYKSECEIRLE